MTTFFTIISFVVAPITYLWRVARLGYRERQLDHKIRELEQYEHLRDLRVKQYNTLVTSVDNYLEIVLKDIRGHVGTGTGGEPYVQIEFRVNNSSVFELSFDDPRLDVIYSNNPLTIPGRITRPPYNISPGLNGDWTFRQPVQAETADALRLHIQERGPIVWNFEISAEFTIVETGATNTLHANIFHHQVLVGN